MPKTTDTAFSFYKTTPRGDLVRCRAPLRQEAGEAHDDYVRRLGYGAYPKVLGTPDVQRLEWHEREGASRRAPQFLAFWCDSTSSVPVLVQDLPQLLRLQAMLSPIIQAATLEERLAEIKDKL